MESVCDLAIHTNKPLISCVGITFAAMATEHCGGSSLGRNETERGKPMGEKRLKEKAERDVEQEAGDGWNREGTRGGGGQHSQPECQPDMKEGEVFKEEK